jgi:hypothetical protein
MIAFYETDEDKDKNTLSTVVLNLIHEISCALVPNEAKIML